MDVDKEDSAEVEEEGDVDLPLTVLPPFELIIEPSPSNVLKDILGQLVPLEEVAESRTRSGQVDARDGQADLTVVNGVCDREYVFGVTNKSTSALKPKPNKEGGSILKVPTE